MLKSLFNIVGDVARVVTAPVEMIVDVAAAITKPIAEVTQDIVDSFKEEIE